MHGNKDTLERSGQSAESIGDALAQAVRDSVQIHSPPAPPAPLNPFDDDEPRTPAAGGDPALQPRRAKFTRAHTGAAASISSSSGLLGPASPDHPPPRARRSLSTDSYAIGNPELMAGQRKAADEKKGSRHVDVIDTWDPTGLGTAMWHHAGPYDAAAPSRNTNLPTTKAPMRAFDKAAAANQPAPPQRGPSTISLSTPPVPPAKDAHRDPTAEPVRRPTRAMSARRPAGSGLTGQYSTSVPRDGGYFPNMGDDLPRDEAAIARMERVKEKESKRMALKAAWGIENPEPFEDFGVSSKDATIDLADDIYSPESTSATLPAPRPVRSPGIRLAPGPRSPPISQDQVSSPLSDSAAPTSRGAVVTATNVPPGGIKRTKSLMQKIKTMVRHKPGSEIAVAGERSGIDGTGSARRSSMEMPAAGTAGRAHHRTPNATTTAAPLSPSLTDSPVLEEDETAAHHAFVDPGADHALGRLSTGDARGGLGLLMEERRAAR